ncbi:DUF2645 family protein [Leclercia adecarboxylata]|nr:DUF2645 family protein [Leclercia adecarboxylata]WJT05273.1 YjeO family protein [Leclercia adecarboxylata]
MISAVSECSLRSRFFLPALYAFLIKKAHHGFLYLITILIAGIWLWRFVFRYQFCLG